MGGVEIKRDMILFYGNTAGFVSDGQAVADPIFRCPELEQYLHSRYTVEWREGLFERLTASAAAPDEPPAPAQCRVWQLRRDVDPRLKFCGYQETLALAGPPRPANYELLYQGQAALAPELRISDVLEVDGRFYFADRRSVREIPFQH